VAARFACDPKIFARRAPLAAMRSDTMAPGAELREQMRQLVAQGSIDLSFAELMQPRI
jgi:hypothetical protein